MYNCPTFFLFWKCLDDMSYWTNLYLTVADDELHFFTFSNLNYTVFVSLAHISAIVAKYGGIRTRLEYNLYISYKSGLYVDAIILNIDRTLNLLS